MKCQLQLKSMAAFFISILIILTSGLAMASVKITLLQTADLHGRIYAHDYALDAPDKDAGLAKIKTLVDRERATDPNTILIDCGDTIQDNSAELFNSMDVHPMISAMNKIGYNVWTLGNHEFNFELSFLEKNIKAFKGDVLSANIYKEGTNDHWVDPYVIIPKAGVRVAIIGMIPPAVPTWESATPQHFEGLTFADPLEETRKAIDMLKGKYDVLVGAYHIGPKGEHGYDGLETIANTFPEFDVLFGGHSHGKVKTEVNGVQIIEPGSYGWALAKAEIELEKQGSKYEVVSVAIENIETAKEAADETILSTYKYVHDKSVEDANLVVGKIAGDFIKRVDYITGDAKVTTMPTSQLQDTAIIDLINDVQMFYTGADVSSAALFNFGSNLKTGDFKKKDVAYIYKYPNTLIGLNISGANLKKYMEWSASYYNSFTPGDLTISFNKDIRGYNYDMFSGCTYEIDLSKAAGNRVVNVMIDGKPLDPGATYKLAVNNYRFGTLMKLGLAAKEDAYYDSIARYTDAPDGRIRDLIIKYTREQNNGTLAPSGRQQLAACWIFHR
jgi:2',3'-cyclic-nucleotide 2'-phosphodiesterase/3'-nucleotidase